MAACSKPGPIGTDPAVAVTELSGLPAPGASDYAAGPHVDLVRPLDMLNITVFGAPDLSRTVRVGSTGVFDYPLIGAVQANGRSQAEIGYEIETRLSGNFVRDPDVTVEFGERIGQYITVGGEVRTPGQFAVLQPMTLMEAVARAGGSTEFSRLSEVLIFREIDGQRYIGVYDVRGIQRGNYPDPRVYPHDIVMVGDSPNRRLMSEVLNYAQLITNPLILLERVAR